MKMIKTYEVFFDFFKNERFNESEENLNSELL